MAQCQCCGLLFREPRLTPDELARLYRDNTYCAWGMHGEAGAVRQMKRATFDSYLDVIEQGGWLGSLLDLGCGTGFLVERALERGWDAFGVEISPLAASEAVERAGAHRILLGTLEEVVLPQSAFDAVTMFDFLEHVPDPKSVLLRVRSAVRPGGVLALTTPFVGGFSHHLMGRRWSQFKHEHLQYFSPPSLTYALRRFGFEVIETGPARKYLTLDYISCHMELYPNWLLTPLVRMIRHLAGRKLARRVFSMRAGDLFAVARRTSL